MVEIRPFKGIHYNKNKIKDITDLITQPYDKISENMQETYYEKNKYNFCKLILPKEENKYITSSKRIKRWYENNILIKEDKLGIYVYYQDFEISGQKFSRKGLISALKLYQYEEEKVLPHEETHKGPKIDRLNMLKATKTDLEPLFMLYSDPDNTMSSIYEKSMKKEPLYEATDIYDINIKIWKIEDPQQIQKVKDFLKGKQLVIADGHHRYETSLTFRNWMRDKNPDWTEEYSFNWKMTYMTRVEDPGLRILPGHRILIKRKMLEEDIDEIEKYFEINEVKLNQAQSFLKENEDTSSFVVYDGKMVLGLRLIDQRLIEKFMSKAYSEDYKNLDVVVLRDVILEGIMNTGKLAINTEISYERWIRDAIGKIDEGKGKTAFLVNSTNPKQVLDIAKNGERMPEKSTDFYPKVNSGFVFMSISEDEKLA